MDMNELVIRVETNVASCNIDAFKAQASQYLANLHDAFETDEDFATVKAEVRELKELEDRTKDAIESVLNGSAEVERIITEARSIAEQFRTERLKRDALVKNKEAEIKDGLIQAGYNEMVAAINANKGVILQALKFKYSPSGFKNRLQEAIKGRRTITSLQAAVNAEKNLAVAEIVTEVNRLNERLRLVPADAEHLFADMAVLISGNEDLTALIAERIEAEKTRQAEQQARQAAEIARQAELKAKAEAELNAKEETKQAEAPKEAQAAPEQAKQEAEKNKQEQGQFKQESEQDKPDPEPQTMPAPAVGSWTVIINFNDGLSREEAIKVAKEIKAQYAALVTNIKLTNTEQ